MQQAAFVLVNSSCWGLSASSARSAGKFKTIIINYLCKQMLNKIKTVLL